MCNSELMATFDVAMACAVHCMMYGACMSSKEAKRVAAVHYLKFPSTWHDTHIDIGLAHTFCEAIASDVKGDTPLFFDRFLNGISAVLTPARAIAVFRVGAEQVLKTREDTTEKEEAREIAAEVVDAYLARLIKAGIENLPSNTKRGLRAELNLCPPVFGKNFDF